MSASTEGLGLTFIGCGQAARTHARVLRRVAPNVRLQFASRDREKGERFARAFRAGTSFASYEAALEDRRAETVLITTPPDRHLELTLAALEAGKNVVVEKPAFFQVEDFVRVRQKAEEAGRRVMVAENYFYKPLRSRLETLLAEGVIGDPLLLRLNAVKRQVVDGWRADPTRAGGRGLFEGGIHWINLISNLGMEIKQVSGFRAGHLKSVSENDTKANLFEAEAVPAEESLTVVIEFVGGMVGTLDFSWEVPSPLRGVRFSTIYGRGGSVWFESNGIFVVVRGSRTRFFVPGLRDLSGYRAMWIDFVDALRSGRDPAMTLDMAERDVRLIRDVYRSIEENESKTER